MSVIKEVYTQYDSIVESTQKSNLIKSKDSTLKHDFDNFLRKGIWYLMYLSFKCTSESSSCTYIYWHVNALEEKAWYLYPKRRGVKV